MKLEGTSVVISGTFEGWDEDELRSALEERGATLVPMSPGVELVIAGDEPGSEYDEARELGIRVLERDALDAVLEGKKIEAPPLAAEPPPESMGEPAEPPPSREALEVLEGASSSTSGGQAAEQGGPPEEGERTFDKGARVKIVSGLEGVGIVGEIFWWGESKYGEGMRAGVRGDDDDETYWVDEEHLGWPDEEIPDDVLEAAEQASEFSKGDRVRVKSGKHEGATGVIFWWGESKWGDGMRAGIESDDDNTIWADAEQLERAEDDADDPIPF